MFIQTHFTLHITGLFFNTHNFEVWTLDPQYLKKIIANYKQVYKKKTN